MAPDAVVANGENVAAGFGATEETGGALLWAVDFLTLGDHASDREGAGGYLGREPRVVRPENPDDGPAGRGWGLFEASEVRIVVAYVTSRLQERRDRVRLRTVE